MVLAVHAETCAAGVTRWTSFPQIRKLAERSQELLDLRPGDTRGAEQLIDGDPAGDRAGAVHLVLGLFEDLAEEPHAVPGAAAVLVSSLVVPRGQEVVDAAQGVPGVDVHDVVASPQGAPHGVAVPAPQVGDVGRGHRARLDRLVAERGHRQVTGAQRDLPAVEVGGVDPVVRQFDAGQGAAFVDGVGDAGERGKILIVPDP
jgi:hypothetical protein